MILRFQPLKERHFNLNWIPIGSLSVKPNIDLTWLKVTHF